MMRRSPVPMSPADVMPATCAVMVKTYWVASTGSMELPLGFQRAKKSAGHHVLRQPGRQQRKRDQDNQANNIGGDKRQHALENRGEGYILDHALDDKDVHADRRMN